jgi:hypothetical protein
MNPSHVFCLQALVMIRSCSGPCCQGKYQGQPIVLEGIGGEFVRWLKQHGVEPWLDTSSVLNKAIGHLVGILYTLIHRTCLLLISPFILQHKLSC